MAVLYNSLETLQAVAFARPFADFFLMGKTSGGIQYPEFHPESNKVSAAYPSDGTLIKPHDSSFDHLFVATFSDERKFEIGIHFGQKTPTLMDLIRFVDQNGRFFLYDSSIESGTKGSRRYERELHSNDLGRMVRACSSSEDISEVVVAAKRTETEDRANTHMKISPPDKVGYFIATTSELNTARLYAAILTDIARGNHKALVR